ncbi:DUF7519 family protein [Halobacterium litoreum]|uniref:Uncharacterized protein n=1 Tax=Halobacterium litoreum TaxID=2039234 RepID=A0ABD5NH77_9EURY|nr:hypothetical protein [Halobacterium litoreum]UHH12815.1 hypothetical protein LT972_11685 [Halobacterium litoreum]
MTAFDARPPVLSLVPAAVGAALALFASTTGAAPVAAGGLGAVALLYGGFDGRRNLVTLGGGLLFFGLVLGASAGVDPRLAILGGVGATVAYDAAEHAVSLGHDVGRDARVGQAVLVHVASTASVAVLVAAFAYVVYEYGPASLPVTGLLALLLAASMLAYALRD